MTYTVNTETKIVEITSVIQLGSMEFLDLAKLYPSYRIIVDIRYLLDIN